MPRYRDNALYSYCFPVLSHQGKFKIQRILYFWVKYLPKLSEEPNARAIWVGLSLPICQTVTKARSLIVSFIGFAQSKERKQKRGRKHRTDDSIFMEMKSSNELRFGDRRFLFTWYFGKEPRARAESLCNNVVNDQLCKKDLDLAFFETAQKEVALG